MLDPIARIRQVPGSCCGDIEASSNGSIVCGVAAAAAPDIRADELVAATERGGEEDTLDGRPALGNHRRAPVSIAGDSRRAPAERAYLRLVRARWRPPRRRKRVLSLADAAPRTTRSAGP